MIRPGVKAVVGGLTELNVWALQRSHMRAQTSQECPWWAPSFQPSLLSTCSVFADMYKLEPCLRKISNSTVRSKDVFIVFHPCCRSSFQEELGNSLIDTVRIQEWRGLADWPGVSHVPSLFPGTISEKKNNPWSWLPNITSHLRINKKAVAQTLQRVTHESNRQLLATEY